MFNSPLHYCKVCKEYVELDQSVEECAKRQDCRVAVCPYAQLFSPPAPIEEVKPAAQDKPAKP